MTIDDMAIAMQAADNVPQRRLRETFSRYQRLAKAAADSICGEWITLECERVHYVDRGKETILCDRLPSPVTIIAKLAPYAGSKPLVETPKSGSIGEADESRITSKGNQHDR